MDDDKKNGVEASKSRSEVVGADGERYYSYSFGARSSGSRPTAPEAGPTELTELNARDRDSVSREPARRDGAPKKTRESDLKARDGDFKVSFDFDKEYEDAPDESPLRVRRERKTGCLSGVMLAIFIVCISLVAASLLWLAATDVFGFGDSDEEVLVTVPSDFTIESVVDMLESAGLIKYKSVFKLYSSFSHSEKTIVPGTYVLRMNYDYHALVHGMTSRGIRATIDVMFPEGYTVAEIFKKLEESGVCSVKDLNDAAANTDFEYSFLDGLPKGDHRRLEGYLFPDTYTFYIGDSAPRVIRKFLDVFAARFKEEYYDKAESLGYTAREILIIASIIEKEAGAASDRTKIASVIYNRLKNPNMPRLEIDATIYYAIAETGGTFSTALDSPYNTYLVEGLPPGPISNPGLEAIKAALNPESTNFYYYALSKDADRHHEFFRTYEEHIAFVNSEDYGG